MVLIALAGVLFAATPDEAAKLFDSQQWEKAAQAYRELTRSDPDAGLYWFRLGVALQSQNQPADAVDAFRQARAKKHLAAGVYIRAAIALTTLDRTAEALEWVEAGFRGGLGPGILNGIPSLEALRRDPAYQALAARYADRCEHSEFRAMDFWIGEWEVRANGRVAGHNRISRVVNGCALEERWTTPAGAEGRSLTWYEPDTAKWRQVYLGSGGGSHDYTGEVKGAGVQFVHSRATSEGARHMFRMTFTPVEGDVRQFIEESWDGGKTWSVWFDGLYVRRR
jgi:hypothetical protein